MKIVFVSEFFWPDVGGLEQTTERLAFWLKNHGHDVAVVTQLQAGLKVAEHKGDLIQIVGFPFTRNLD